MKAFTRLFRPEGDAVFTPAERDLLLATWGRLALPANVALRAVLAVLLIPTMLLEIPLTFLGGLVMAIPVVGLVYIVGLTLLWLPFLAVLLGTSWLWKQLPPLRPLLPLLGIPVAALCNVLVAVTPGGATWEDRQAKQRKLAICDTWPLSLELVAPTPSPPRFVWRSATEDELAEALSRQPAKPCRQHSPLLVSTRDRDKYGCWYTVLCAQCGKVASGYAYAGELKGQSLGVNSLPPHPWRKPTDAEAAEIIASLGRRA